MLTLVALSRSQLICVRRFARRGRECRAGLASLHANRCVWHVRAAAEPSIRFNKTRIGACGAEKKNCTCCEPFRRFRLPAPDEETDGIDNVQRP